MILRWRRPGSQRYGTVLFTFFVVLLVYHAISNNDLLSSAERQPVFTKSQQDTNPLLADHAVLWRSLYSNILFNDPKCSPPEHVGLSRQLDVGFDPAHDPPRPDTLWLSPADLAALEAAHTKFLQDITATPPPVTYHANSHGIVTTAGPDQFPVLLISIRMLRLTGCTLPVEVFLATTTPHTQQICTTILLTLNAKCIILNDIVSAAGTGVTLTQYQYKIMALLFSSFSSVLLLDSDAFPIHDPTPLFTSPPLTTHGMILWPDFWYMSESPYFFTIAHITDIPPLNAHPATESGEILLDKTRHNVTLLLAAYYNYYGPDFYYPLQSQGAPGQGDKETFGWAAAATNSTVYRVHTPVAALGHDDSSGEFFGSAMAQHDPFVDWEVYWRKVSPSAPSQDKGSDTTHTIDADVFPAAVPVPTSHDSPPDLNNSSSSFDSPSSHAHPKIRPFFIHANHPKPNPFNLFSHAHLPASSPSWDGQRRSSGPLYDTNHTALRPWGGKVGRVDDVGGAVGDVEWTFWRVVQGVACEFEGVFVDEESAMVGQGAICGRVKEWREEVFGMDVKDLGTRR